MVARSQYFLESILDEDVINKWMDPASLINWFSRPTDGFFLVLDQMDSAFRSAEKKFYTQQQDKKEQPLVAGSKETEDRKKSPVLGDPYQPTYISQLGAALLKKLQARQTEERLPLTSPVFRTTPPDPHQFSINHAFALAHYSTSQIAIENSTTRLPPALHASLKRSELDLVKSLFRVEDPVVNSLVSSSE